MHPPAGIAPLRIVQLLFHFQPPRTYTEDDELAFIFPAFHLIYRAPPWQTMTVGITRVATIVLCAGGTFYTLVVLRTDPDAPKWLIPAGLLASFAPLALAVGSGPMVSSIRLHLPDRARRSREALLRFSSHLPVHQTRVRLQFIRFAPWFVTRDVWLADLRRIRPTWTSLSTMEHIPPIIHERIESEKRDPRFRISLWLSRRYMGRFWVQMGSAQNKGSIWEYIWEQMPWEGNEWKGTKEQRIQHMKMERRVPGNYGVPNRGIQKEEPQ